LTKKSNRQIGDRPKVARSFRLDPTLNEAMITAATSQSISQIEWLENAIRQKLEENNVI